MLQQRHSGFTPSVVTSWGLGLPGGGDGLCHLACARGDVEHLWVQRGQVPGQHCWLRAATHNFCPISISSWHRMCGDTTQGSHLWGLGLRPELSACALGCNFPSLGSLPLQAAASWGALSVLTAVKSGKAADPGKKSPAIPFFCFAAWRENERSCESSQVEIAKFQRTLCKSFSTVFQLCFRVSLSHRFQFQSWC